MTGERKYVQALTALPVVRYCTLLSSCPHLTSGTLRIEAPLEGVGWQHGLHVLPSRPAVEALEACQHPKGHRKYI